MLVDKKHFDFRGHSQSKAHNDILFDENSDNMGYNSLSFKAPTKADI